MAPTHEIDQELVKLNQSYEPIFNQKTKIAMNPILFTTLAEFKRKATQGSFLKTTHYLHPKAFKGRDEAGKCLYDPYDMGTRGISIQQTNSIALKTETDKGAVDSWFHFPAAKECTVIDNALHVYSDSKKDTLIMVYTIVG
jgi:hypothetical protein